ncbi:tetratricopeptide repeat protein [Actinoplanes sp. NPDC026670]|uniref:tetratricopeptide repeat protein n=1 Tax=Actinoplanes sp. NPDC026670 TaxID=3154700 RepID=UPI00340F4613
MAEFRNPREICPHCRLPAVPILYGYPGPSAEELMHIGRAVGGGCVVDSAMPTLSCPRRHRWRPAGPVALPARGADAMEDFVIAAARTYLGGDLAGAERAYREAVALVGGALGPAHEETLLLRHALAVVLYAAGRTAEGEDEYRAMRAAAGRPLWASAVPTAEEFDRFVAETRDRRRRLDEESLTDDDRPIMRIRREKAARRADPPGER